MPSSNTFPVAQEAVSVTQSGQEDLLPKATAVVVEPLTATAFPPTHTIKDIVHQEMSTVLKKEQTKNRDLLSSFQVAVMKEVSEAVVRETSSFLKNYSSQELPGAVSSRVDTLFPRFAANNPMIKRHLEAHLRSIDEMVNSRQQEAAFQLDNAAKAAADKMARTDTFGYIYESVVNTAHKRVTEESMRVQADLFVRLEAELQTTRTQRDVAMQQFASLSEQLEGHVSEHKAVKILAISGFCLGMASLTSVVLSSLFEKR